MTQRERPSAADTGVFERPGTAEGLLAYLKAIVEPFPDLQEKVRLAIAKTESELGFCHEHRGDHRLAKSVVCHALDRVIHTAARRYAEHARALVSRGEASFDDEEKAFAFLEASEDRCDYYSVIYHAGRVIASRLEGGRLAKERSLGEIVPVVEVTEDLGEYTTRQERARLRRAERREASKW